MLIRKCISVVALALVFWSALPTERVQAEEAEAVVSDSEPQWSVALRGGVSAFLKTQSFAFNHMVKPTVRIEVLTRLAPGFEVGVEAAGVVTDEGGYELFGGYLVGRAAMVEGEVFSMWLGWGIGAGTNGAIVWSDLNTSDDLMLWHELGIHTRWDLVDDMFGLGVDLFVEHLSVATLTTTAYFRF